MSWEYTIESDAEAPAEEAPFDSEAAIARYQQAMLALLPPGLAWSKELDSNLGQLLGALAVEPARIDEGAEAVLRNASPLKADEYIDDWEEALGLPGSCVTTASTELSERRGAIATKLRGRTSHSQAAFEAAASDLGYTELEFSKYSQFRAGSSTAGDAIYGDEWMYVVHVDVPVGDQTADDELICIFTDQLRRSHGWIDITLEGPMGATREHTANYLNNHALSADFVLADVAPVELKYSGFLSIQVIIDNGAGGAPTDTPAGVWEAWISSGGSDYSLWDPSAVTTELARVAPNGNNVVSEVAVLTNVPGQYVKVLYNLTSGGGTDAKATMHLTAW